MAASCPAILSIEGKAWIDNSLCTGCDLCLQICRFDAIHKVPAGEALQ
ncbi:MAG: 4Fe-4S binding protein [Rhodocyclaceae bacterium]|nr:4Fe-4S binding protein [Rhodocyclaceae bacterium]